MISVTMFFVLLLTVMQLESTNVVGEEIDCPKVCGLYSMPVCGNDGKTYDNPCELKRKRCNGNPELEVVKNRGCDEEIDCPKACGWSYMPVCGNDGKTYDNPCELKRKRCNGNPELKVVKNRGCNECPSGQRRNMCLVNPCDGATCPGFKLATCKPNYCGGCFADFYILGLKVDCIDVNGAKSR